MEGRYLGLVRDHGEAIADAVADDPTADVPSCPTWTLRDLGAHLVAVLDMWCAIVRTAVEPPGRLGLVYAAEDEQAVLVQSRLDETLALLAATPSDAPAWTWWGEDTVGSIPRRLAFEALVHHWDAANALGRAFDVPADVAVDGIEEFHELILPLTDAADATAVVGRVRLQLTDAPSCVVVADGVALPRLATADDEPVDAVVHGSAGDVLLALWRRLPLDFFDVTGDADLVRQLVDLPYLGPRRDA